MNVPKRIFRNWKLQKEHGDAEAIHNETVKNGHPISAVTIRHALKTGKCSEDTMKAIHSFYAKKPAMVKKKESDLIKELDGE